MPYFGAVDSNRIRYFSCYKEQNMIFHSPTVIWAWCDCYGVSISSTRFDLAFFILTIWVHVCCGYSCSSTSNMIAGAIWWFGFELYGVGMYSPISLFSIASILHCVPSSKVCVLLWWMLYSIVCSVGLVGSWQLCESCVVRRCYWPHMRVLLQ